MISTRNILPAHTSRHHTKRLILHLVLLVEHEQICWPPVRSEGCLAMIDSPFQLLGRDQYLTEAGVYTSLATVETCRPSNIVLVVQDEFE